MAGCRSARGNYVWGDRQVFGWRAGAKAAKVAGECRSTNCSLGAALEGLTEAIARFKGAEETKPR